MTKFFFHAPNVNYGGGLILLKDLVENLNKKKIDYTISLDSRLIKEKFIKEIKSKKFVNPSLNSRIFFDLKLIKIKNKYDKFIFFGNLGPLFFKFQNSFLFIQNRFLIDSNSYLKELNTKNFLRIILERLWLKISIKNVSKVIVQTYTMKKLLIKNFRINENDIIIKTFHSHIPSNTKHKKTKYIDCLVITSLEKHKNIDNLISALIILSCEYNFRPKLKLIIGGSNKENSKIQNISNLIIKYKLNISLSFSKNHKYVMNSLRSSKSLLFVSKLESLGLPLLEARSLSIPVIAPELDFIRDIVNPHQTFDPNSPISISRSIMRFFKIKYDLNMNNNFDEIFYD